MKFIFSFFIFFAILRDRLIFRWLYLLTRRELYREFKTYKVCYTPDADFDRELNLITIFCIDPDLFESDDVCLRYRSSLPDLPLSILNEYNRLYYADDIKFGTYTVARVCCGAGKYHNTEKILSVHVSNECSQKFYDIVSKCINKPFERRFSALDKIALCVTIIAIITMVLALFDVYDAGFYNFLRWFVCLSYVNGIVRELAVPIRVISVIGAVLYNPIAQIYLRDRDMWCVFNVISIIFLIVIQILTYRGVKNHGITQAR